MFYSGLVRAASDKKRSTPTKEKSGLHGPAPSRAPGEPGGARRSQERPGGARRSQEEPGKARRSQGSQEEPGEPGVARRSQGEPGGVRRSQEEPSVAILAQGPRPTQPEDCQQPLGLKVDLGVLPAQRRGSNIGTCSVHRSPFAHVPLAAHCLPPALPLPCCIASCCSAPCVAITTQHGEGRPIQWVWEGEQRWRKNTPALPEGCHGYPEAPPGEKLQQILGEPGQHWNKDSQAPKRQGKGQGERRYQSANEIPQTAQPPYCQPRQRKPQSQRESTGRTCIKAS